MKKITLGVVFILCCLIPTLAIAEPFAYITNNISNDVSVIDTATNTVIATIPVGTEPRGITVNPSGTRVYVTNFGSNNVSVIDTKSNTVIGGPIPVGTWPVGIAVNPSGTRVYVANSIDDTVSVIDTATNTVIATIDVGATPWGVAVNPSGTRVYVANRGDDTVSVIDTATNTVIPTIDVGTFPVGIAVNPSGTRVYVANSGSNNVSVIDTATNSVIATIDVGTQPWGGIAVNPSGTRVYVTNHDSNNVSVIDTATNTVIGPPIPVGTDPWGVSVNPSDTLVYVANNGSNNVSVIDTATNTVIDTITVGDEPIAFGIFIRQSLARIADSILFPWVVQSDDVTTVISVINTAQTWAESVGLPFHNNRIHIEYWHKLTTVNDQEEQCREYNFEVTSSKDDMVTWDMAGHFNNGLPMFNDTSNEVIGVPDLTLAVENPRRAFLIVDNATDALNDAGTNVDGTMYGEATIIEHKTGAAWGYIAYNAVGGPENFSDADYRDQSGEVIGRYETTQTTLLNPNDAITKLFVTPTGMNQRRGNLNARVQLCRFPELNPGPDGVGGRIDSDPYTGNCESGGIWNNEEGGFSFTVEKDIVCTTADNIVEFFGGAGTSAYTQWVASGKAGWTYLVTQSGNIDVRDGREAHEEADEAIIGKLEYGTGLNWDGSIADTINTFVWLEDESYYAEHCFLNFDWRCKPGGINIIHNEFYENFEQLPN